MSSPARPRLLPLIIVLVAFGPVSTDLYLPSLPRLVQVFGASSASVQLTLSVFLVGFACGMLVYGPLSDRFGRRSVLMGGILLFILARVANTAGEGDVLWRPGGGREEAPERRRRRRLRPRPERRRRRPPSSLRPSCGPPRLACEGARGSLS